MAKKIKESYIKKLVIEALNEASSYINDTTVKKWRKDIENRMQSLVNSNDESMLNILQTLGYDKEYNSTKNLDIRRRLFKNNEIAKEVCDDILEVASILRQYTDGGGNVYTVRNERNDIDTSKRRYLEDDYSGEDLKQILRLKDFMDIHGLTSLYDETSNLPSRTMGLKKDKNGVNYGEFDMNKISDAEARNYANGKITEDEARFKIRQKLISDYIASKYGMQIVIPSINFSNGNKKIPTTTLIVNFDSAIGCPAWNECLVKHACYARNTEKGKPTVYVSNKKKNIGWRQTENDPEMMNLMLNMIRAYCFDYEKAAAEMISSKVAKFRSPKKLAEKLSSTPFSDVLFTQEVLDVLMKYKRIDNIRLNENGDFIGQWLVDAWDIEAGEFKIVGINVSAYTCRHLNYNGIKNIILNTSFKTDNSNIARNFIAVPDFVYDSLDETYGGENNQLIINENDTI